MAKLSITAAWFRREDYHRFRAMVDDPSDLPDSFDDWQQFAEQQIAEFAAKGMAVEKVIIDPDGFRAFCAAAKIKPNGEARARYAVTVFNAQKAGHA